MSDDLDQMLGFEKIAPDDTPFDAASKGYRNSILCMEHGATILRARIAALEATVARLTAPFGPEDAEVVERVNGKWIENVHPDYAEALFTAFLERRMKG